MTIVRTRHPIIPLRPGFFISYIIVVFQGAEQSNVISNSPSLNVSELGDAERYWILLSQQEHLN